MFRTRKPMESRDRERRSRLAEVRFQDVHTVAGRERDATREIERRRPSPKTLRRPQTTMSSLSMRARARRFLAHASNSARIDTPRNKSRPDFALPSSFCSRVRAPSPSGQRMRMDGRVFLLAVLPAIRCE